MAILLRSRTHRTAIGLASFVARDEAGDAPPALPGSPKRRALRTAPRERGLVQARLPPIAACSALNLDLPIVTGQTRRDEREIAIKALELQGASTALIWTGLLGSA